MHVYSMNNVCTGPMPAACRKQAGDWPEFDMHEQFILKLILDDLVNICFTVSLEKQGINAQKYYLCLTEQVFELLEINDRLDLHELYFDLALQVMEKDICKKGEVWQLALEIYARMIQEKEQRS